MDSAPTIEDITARRTVRFAKGHLAKHTGWTGTLVGYNDLYDTVHVYVDAPGNPESGSKITYSRKDVEFVEDPEEDTMDFDAYDKLPHFTWTTTDSYPVLGIQYQEAETSMGTLARVMASGFEVVSPDTDTDAVYKQFHSRADRALNSLS